MPNDTVTLPTVEDTPFDDCHGFRHQWQRVKVESYGGTEQVTWQCSACTTECSAIYNKHGALMSPARYKYPEGYVNKGGGRRDRAEVRTRIFRSARSRNRHDG